MTIEITPPAEIDAAQFDERVAALVAHADAVTVEQCRRNGWDVATATTHTAERVSDKWIRIVAHTGSQTLAFAFVAAQDNYTKALGQVRRGDIHKTDGWKRAARHARGSIFAADFGGCVGPYGIAYLK